MVCKRTHTSLALALAALVSTPMSQVFAFAPPHNRIPTSTKSASPEKAFALQASASSSDNKNELVKGAVGFFAGLGIAAQVAFADPTAIVTTTTTATTTSPSSIMMGEYHLMSFIFNLISLNVFYFILSLILFDLI